MEEKRIQAYDDLSNERGFQFEFFCEHCRKSYKSEFIASKHYNSGKRKRNAGAAASFIGNIFGGLAETVGSKIDEGLNSINDHTDESLYDKEKAVALANAQEEAEKLLHQCKECENWFCDDCYNKKTHLCLDCDEARREREREEAEELAEQIRESSIVYCPNCGEEIPPGMKFCGNCGTRMDAVKICPKCKKKNKFTMQYCGYCGAKLKEK